MGQRLTQEGSVADREPEALGEVLGALHGPTGIGLGGRSRG